MTDPIDPVEAAWEALSDQIDDAIVRGGWRLDELSTDVVLGRHRPIIEAAIQRRTLVRDAMREVGKGESRAGGGPDERLRREIEAIKPWTFHHAGIVDELLPRPTVIALLDAAYAKDTGSS